MKTRLVIFDFDGVIVDSHRVVPKIYSIIARELEVPRHLHSEELHRGDFYDVDYRKTLAKLGIWEPSRIREAERIWEAYCDKFWADIKLFPGIKKTIRSLSQEYRLAILSNNTQNRIEKDLRRYGIIDAFSLITSALGDESKPNPIGILRCMDVLKASPKESVYIGDMEGDIIAAKKAKVKKAIAVSYGWHSHEKLLSASPDVIVKKPQDLIVAVR